MKEPASEPEREPGIDAPYVTKTVRDQRLVTRDYYREIDQEMAALEKPTIGDAVKAMCRKANKPFFEHDWLVKTVMLTQGEVDLEKDGFTARNDFHELVHLISRLAHTPTQEQMVYPMDLGMRLGVGIAHPSYKEHYREGKEQGYREAAAFREESNLEPVEPACSRDSAIYFAMGLYFQAKIKLYRRLGGDYFKSYEDKQKFCSDYAKQDIILYAPLGCEDHDYTIKDLIDLPYEFLQITPEEKRAIISVALNLKQPEETNYPNRMGAIRAALVNTGELHDGKSWIERMQRNHSKVHPEGEAFDLQKLQAAREKQKYR